MWRTKNTTTDEYLRPVMVGYRKPFNSTVCLAPYDPDRTKQFSLQAKQVRDALAERVLLLEHVGSTSVPGLSAKPVIDMVLAVSNSADEPSYLLLSQRKPGRTRSITRTRNQK